MVWIFWIGFAFVVYSLIGYPMLLGVVSMFHTATVRREEIWPPISIIIVVHNAAGIIGQKIKNTLEMVYPREKLEVIVGSDGSTDGTGEVVRAYEAAGVKLLESRERRGKHHTQMLARDACQGEILVFTDASVLASPDVLQKMIPQFADPSVGCISSVDQAFESRKNWVGEHFYVYGEMGLRLLESRVNSVVSMSGSFYGARREVCKTWHPDMSSDFFVALHTVSMGLRAILDPECKVRVGAVRSDRRELARKVRTIVHGLVVFFSHVKLLNPFRYPLFSWQLASHKLCRWLLPLGFIALLASNIFLWSHGRFYQVALVTQLIGYIMGLLSHGSSRLSQFGLFRVAGFFLVGNVATLVAWWKFCRGDKIVTWEPSIRG